jgi:DNA recombination protein RmuC
MNQPTTALLVGIAFGALLAWLVLWAQIRRVERERDLAERYRDRAQAALDAHKTTEQQLRDTFGALSGEALAANNSAFLEQAKLAFGELQQAARGDLELRKQSMETLVEPIKKGLEQIDTKLQAFDRSRAESQGALEALLRSMGDAQQALTAETQALVTALRAPTGRGQWGELQLRRVVELAGMMEHADFVEQKVVATDTGAARPDLVVHLPGDKVVIVDAKAPLSAYLDAINTTDEAQRNLLLDQHAKQVRTHVEQLARRDYAREFSEAPDFVVLFLPGEAFFAAACQRDPNLLDFAIGKGVVPASPTTLITLLKAVNYGWQQERIAVNAESIRDAGMMLYERMRVLADHLGRIRKGLDGAVGAYNDAVGSLETRVLPAARKFKDLGVGNGDGIAVLEEIDHRARIPAAVELQAETADS